MYLVILQHVYFEKMSKKRWCYFWNNHMSCINILFSIYKYNTLSKILLFLNHMCPTRISYFIDLNMCLIFFTLPTSLKSSSSTSSSSSWRAAAVSTFDLKEWKGSTPNCNRKWWSMPSICPRMIWEWIMNQIQCDQIFNQFNA